MPQVPDQPQLSIKFKASPGHILSSRLAWAIDGLVSRKKEKKIRGRGGRKTKREQATEVT